MGRTRQVRGEPRVHACRVTIRITPEHLKDRLRWIMRQKELLEQIKS